MEILIVLLLIVMNGIFAMSEIAIVSSRKSRLQKLANEGDKKAQAALELSRFPNRFLSTVQIGITFVGIFAGAFGGETIARTLAAQMREVPIVGPYSDGLALLLVVLAITYLSLVIGELVPKRLALSDPERVARWVARPMNFVSAISSPMVSFLTFSTDALLGILSIKPAQEPSVSEEEVRMLVREGARVGVFNIAEKDIVERTFRLGDKKVNTLMTARRDIVCLDTTDSFQVLRNKIANHPHSHYPIVRGSLDKVIGVVLTEDLLTGFLKNEKFALSELLHKPVLVPESTEALKVLEYFKLTGIHMALVVDEYGSVLGLVTLTDILEEIVGDIPDINEIEEKEIMKRADGSHLVDGFLPIDEFKEFFQIKRLPNDTLGTYSTVGGFMMSKLERIPVSGDHFEVGNLRFEVMDMDGNRVDKILVKRVQ